MIRSIIERTGVKIDVEDDGRVNVASADGASAQKAISIIQELTATPELNKTYLGKIQRITDFGAFVEIMPGTDGLLHVSEIANHRVKDVRDELKEGEQILVKVINIDPTGKIRLSRKALLQPEEAAQRTAGANSTAEPPRTQRLMGSDSQTLRFRITLISASSACSRCVQLRESLRRGDAFADRRMAVEQPLHDLRGMLFGEVLRAEPAHRRDERGRVAASARARSGRRSARRRATWRARPAASAATRRRRPAAAAAARPTSAGLRKPERRRDPAAAARDAAIEAGENQRALEDDPFPDVAVHVMRELVRQHHLDLLVRVLGQHRVRHENPPRPADAGQRRVRLLRLRRRVPIRRRRARARRASASASSRAPQRVALERLDAVEQRQQEHRRQVGEADDEQGEERRRRAATSRPASGGCRSTDEAAATSAEQRVPSASDLRPDRAAQAAERLFDSP